MYVDIDKFIKFIRKATLNFQIKTIKIEMTRSRIKSAMWGATGQCTVVMDKPNDIFGDVDKDESYVLLFAKPEKQLVRLLSIYKGEICDVEVSVNDIEVSGPDGTLVISFSNPLVITSTDLTEPKDLNYFLEDQIDDDFIDIIDKIIPLKLKQGRFLVSVKNGVCSIGVGTAVQDDETGIECKFREVEIEYLTLVFHQQAIINLMKIIGNKYYEYSLSFICDEERKKGLIAIERNDETEFYYLEAIKSSERQDTKNRQLNWNKKNQKKLDKRYDPSRQPYRVKRKKGDPEDSKAQRFVQRENEQEGSGWGGIHLNGKTEKT